MNMKIRSNWKTTEGLISFFFCLITTILILLGFSASESSRNLADAEGLSGYKYVGLSTAAWHQEIDIYFTLKVLSPEKSPGFGLREPIQIESESGNFLPLKFSDYTEFSSIDDRPYLSSSGILADLARIGVGFLSFFGIPKLFGLFMLYMLNLVLNGTFVFLLLKFGKFFLSRRLPLNIYRLAVVSPWVILDSTSIMFSPGIRFGGIFALLLLWHRKGSNWQYNDVFAYSLIGIVISSLNGFEFFFFELSILLLFLFVLTSQSIPWVTLLYWLSLSLTAWLTSILIWFITIFSNLRNVDDSVRLITYTLFKHSFLRVEQPPLGAVASGDSSLALLEGLTKLSSRMSIFLPYPFPESFQAKLHLSDQLLSTLNVMTSVVVLLFIMLLISRGVNRSRAALIGIGFWCLSAIPVNSYVYNHPHHMPPVGLFLILSIFIHFFRDKPKNEYSNS
jgi:hypothetical protein